jgi:beta-galactosidase
VVRTAGAPVQLTLTPDRPTIKADGQDLAFITVTVADQAGQLTPRSHNHVAFELTGPGEIIGVDNGDATSFEPFQANERKAYNGLCLAIVRSTGQPGPISLKATSPGLRPATVDLKAK